MTHGMAYYRVVVADGIDGVEVLEVVFVGGIIAVPGHHIEGGEGHGGLKQHASILIDRRMRHLHILIGRYRIQEIFGVRQAIGT